jgi:hypothetical protein
VRRAERYAPLTGIGAVVLWVVGTLLLEKDDRPDGKSTADLVAWVEENDTAILAGGIVFAFGVLLFLWMLGSLRTRLDIAEAGSGHLAALAFGSGIATSFCLMAAYLPHAQAAFDHENISDTSVDALVHQGDAFFGAVELFAIPLVLATALASFRHDAFPRWFGWFGLVLAALLAFPPIGWLAVFLGLPLWVLIASVLLYARTDVVSVER